MPRKTVARPLLRHCSVDRTLRILSDPRSFLVLREIYLGARRFEQIQGVLRMPRSTLSERLTHLVETNVLRREPYGESTSRFDYRLTERGLDLYLVMLALLRYGDDWLAGGARPPMVLIHTKCAHVTHPETICSHCRQPIRPHDVTYRDGPGAGFAPAPETPQRRRGRDGDSFERGRPSSVSRTLGILADRWTFLVVRNAFFGVRRFDNFQDDLAIAPNILTDRLSRLVEQNILRREKYQDLPDRFEYRLTKAGRDLYMPLIQMLRWGDRWLGEAPPLLLRHTPCDHEFQPVIACDHCHAPIDPHDIRYRLNYPRLRQDSPPALLGDRAEPPRRHVSGDGSPSEDR
jgi:DNA-binding HxlR family transcriptional regulator